MGRGAENSEFLLNREVEDSHVRQPISVLRPSRAAVRRIENAAVRSDVKIVVIERIDHKGIG